MESVLTWWLCCVVGVSVTSTQYAPAPDNVIIAAPNQRINFRPKHTQRKGKTDFLSFILWFEILWITPKPWVGVETLA